MRHILFSFRDGTPAKENTTDGDELQAPPIDSSTLQAFSITLPSIYSLLQMGIMGWQMQTVKNMQWEYEGRQLPATGGIDAFQARFPGLYAIYTETPERRRINAMFVIVLVNIFLSFVHFFMSSALLYGAFKYDKNFVWPWIFSAAPIIIMSTTYAVLWWSGDVFNEQLTMSVAEFVMSLANNGICLVIVVFFYWRLIGKLTSDKPAQRHSLKDRTPLQCQRTTAMRYRPPATVPQWREEWPAIPDRPLQKKLRRQERRSRSKPTRLTDGQGSLDFFAPQPYDNSFPWKVHKLQTERRKRELRPHSASEAIERLYYNNYPDDLPGLPHEMRSSLRKDRKHFRRTD